MGLALMVALLLVSFWAVFERPQASRFRALLLGQALLAAAATAYLISYVVGEDDYRGGGISRWEAYGAHPLTIGAIAAGLAVCVLAALADRRGGLLLRTVGPAGILASVALVAALAANSLN